MTGLPARRVELVAPSKPDADWTARLALGGAAAFTLLLFAFGFILYKSWPQMSGADHNILALTDKTDRIANSQESISRDIASLRTDLRTDRTDRADGSREVAVLRARVGDLTATMASLREQAEKLEAATLAVPVPAPAPAPAAPAPAAAHPDPAITELRTRLDALQRKLDELVAAPAAPAPLPQPSPPVMADAAAVKPAPVRPPSVPAPAYPVDEIEREVRDMQSVIKQQQARADAARSTAVAATPPAPARKATGFANPLAPITSKTPPRIAPTRPAPTTGRVSAPSVSRVPSEPFAQQTVKPSAPSPRSAGPEPRVSSIGVNSAMKSIGPIGLPFDALGNLVAAIGEGLDTLFTGREYLPRTAEDESPSTARAAR